MRMTKEGKIDKRAYSSPKNAIGNKGGAGRPLASYERRRNFKVRANDTEYQLIIPFCRLLKADEKKAMQIACQLGSVPTGRAKKDDTRTGRTLACTTKEKDILKKVIRIIKDRPESTRLIFKEYNILQK